MRGRTAIVVLLAGVLAAPSAWAQAARKDAIWARSTAGAPITLDGNLNEAAWSTAESWVLRYHADAGIPGSGYKDEAGFPGSDSTNAILKFLVVGNQLYMGATVPDKSIGGSGQFNRFDGFLMAMKDHAASGFPKPPAEYFYSWWYPHQSGDVNPCDPDSTPGLPPTFRGRWARDTTCAADGSLNPRSAEQIAAWDAVTVVNGVTNSDVVNDVGYTVEMRFNLTPMGYDVTQPGGDIVEWNISIYDVDYAWPITGFNFGASRVWWQCPWGNVAEQNEVRIYARPDVTTSSGPVPNLDPEFRIPNGSTQPTPAIDGSLADAVWSLAPSFDIRYGDEALRASYPSVGKWRSGEYQPPVHGVQSTVFNGGDATVKYFFKGDWLYLGFDVRDQYVQHHSLFDRMDGFLVSVTDRAVRDPLDHNLEGRKILFQVAQNGTALAPGGEGNQLPTYLSGGNALVGVQLKAGTVVDTTGCDAFGDPQEDTGYTAELAIKLTALGYPAGLGDGSIFLGIDHLDGDSFGPPGPIPITSSYSTRTWWFREREEQCCPVWGYLDPALGLTVGVGDGPAASGLFMSLGNEPNPFEESTRMRFALARTARVDLDVFDVGGRLLRTRSLGVFEAGSRESVVRLEGLGTGVYFYRLRAADPESGAALATMSGRMMHLR
jgi:hypothetical protein